MRKQSVKDIETLRQTLKEKLPDLHSRYGITQLGIFGSYAHGVQKRRSDIDILVEFDDQAEVTLVGFLALERELGKMLGHKVDLVERESLKPVIGKRILEELILV